MAGSYQTVSKTVNGQTTDYPYIHTEAFSAVHGASAPAAAFPPVVGKALSYSDSHLALQLENGTTKTYAVSPQWFEHARPTAGQWYAVTADASGNVTRVALADQAAYAIVENVTKDSVTLKLQDGRTIVARIASFASTPAHMSAGMRVMLTTHDGGYTSSLSVAN